MNILIIEDEAPAIRRLEKLLREILPNLQILDYIDNVNDAIKKIPVFPQIDLIMMDIQLADGLSFEIFEAIDINYPIIFTTAFDEYALKAFQVNSVGYLLKPIDKEELNKSLQKLFFLKNNTQIQSSETENSLNLKEIIKQIQIEKKEYKNRFLVKMGEKLHSIQTNEIAYFQADEKIVCLVTQDEKKYFLNYSLDDLENILQPNDFFRLNRQFITHISAIQNIQTYFNGKLKITLFPTPKIQDEILVSRERSNIFKSWLDK